MGHQKKQLSSFQIIIFGFLLVILTGSLLLMLPFSTAQFGGASFPDALFTATSAVCVTGLVVQDTATYWSLFGQIVIILLIQIGGMGVVTLAVVITMVSGRKISLKQRSTLQEAISAPQMGGIVRLTGFIVRTTIGIELLGALIMAPVFCRDFGIAKGIFYALFHSISAFCNAGFDLMGVKAPFSSLVDYVGSPVVSLTIGGLIVVGGIGFLTWDDIRSNRFHFKRYRMQSKVILVTTALLIVLPALYFYFVEFSGAQWAFLRPSERFLAALFQSITPRTAGFNTVDLNKLGEPSQVITIILMLIGGSPGSTAGGVKTTTIAVLLWTATAVFRRSEDTRFWGRRIAEEAVRSAVAIAMMYLTLTMLGAILISNLEGLPMLPCLFEASSAIGTVGLTLGVTPHLGLISRMVLVALMYFGRVGGLTLVFAAISNAKTAQSRLPLEKITVG